MSDPINWQVVEDAIYDWFAGRTLVPVVWANQDSPQPRPYPYGTLNIIAGPTMEYPLDETRQETNLGRQNGEEVSHIAEGWRQFTVSCQAYQGPPATIAPGNHARTILQRAQSSLALLSVQDAFRAAGLAVVRQSNIENIDQVIEETWISGANMDVIFRTTARLEERTGYIDSVEVSSTGLGLTKTIG